MGGQLKPVEVENIIQKVGFGSVSRVLRSAETYPLWAGIKVGLELPITPSGGIGEYGDGKGTIGGVLLGPRLYLCKGLSDGFEITFNFFQAQMLNTPGTFGVIVKYNFAKEDKSYATLSTFFGYTNVNAFTSSASDEVKPVIAYKGRDLELGIYGSKEYVKFKPYAGLAVLFAQGEIRPELTVAESSASQGTIHLFLGSEFEWPMNFTAQLDFMNLAMMGSLGFAFKF
ncbi:MAG: hypothetical protein EBQ85_09400 [Proteobacteria bacterium]|nr:hypothetical protein [Pseudomonadota bacterium]